MTFIPIHELNQRSTRPARVTLAQRNRLPPWVKVQMKTGQNYQSIQKVMKRFDLHTICQEARCPNVWECWNNGTATFLILGDICTRRCHYCSVETGRPLSTDFQEPLRVARAVQTLGLRHAVITSVNRDDLEDGGASQFAETIRHIARLLPSCTTEVLIPDFRGSRRALTTILSAKPSIVNHNIETVRTLFPLLRPQGKYERSLQYLKLAKKMGATTKSGLIIGMGESEKEIRDTLDELRTVGCDIVTIGQYLQPTKDHLQVKKYYHPEEFAQLREEALALGFTHVESGPLVRSSYHAEQQTHHTSKFSAPAQNNPSL